MPQTNIMQEYTSHDSVDSAAAQMPGSTATHLADQPAAGTGL